MKIHEPTTLVTDYLLGGLAVVLGLRVLRTARGTGRTAARLWAWALLLLGVAAFAGGTWHGFAPEWSAVAGAALWKVTLLAVGGASCAMLAGSVWATVTSPWRRWLAAAAVGKLAVYLAWMALHDDFRYVIYDTASAFAGVLLLHAAALRRREPAAGWIVAGVVASLLAASIQASGVALHPRFNHNDLYHVAQMGALVLLARGARALRDAGF